MIEILLQAVLNDAYAIISFDDVLNNWIKYASTRHLFFKCSERATV